MAQTMQNRISQWTDTAKRFSGTGAYDSAIYYLQKAKDARMQSREWLQAASLLIEIMINQVNREDYAAAEATLSEVLQFIKDHKITDAATLASVYNEAGVLHHSMGDYERAIQDMKQSLTWNLQGNSNPAHLAVEYSNIGSILNRMGDYDEAIFNFNKSLALYTRQNPNSLDVAEAHTSLCVAYYRKRLYRQAIAHGTLSLQIFDRLKGQDLTRQYINGYNAMAVAHAAVGEYDAALAFLKRALALQRTSEHMLAKTHHNLGHVYWLMNDHPQALIYLRRAIAENQAQYGASHPDIGKACRHIGVMCADRGEYDSALYYFQRALTIFVPGFNKTGFAENPAIGAGINAKPDLLRALNDKGKALLKRAGTQKDGIDDLKVAFKTYQTALELLDLMRGEYELEDSRQFINQDAMPIYNYAMQAAMALYNRENNPAYLEAAFSISERSRALMLLESLQYRQSKALLGVPDSLLIKEKNLKRHIAYYENNLAGATANSDPAAMQRNKEYLTANQEAYRKLIDRFKTHYPAYYSSKYIQPVSLKTLQQTLPDAETALLEFFAGENFIYSIIATRTACVVHSIPRDAALDSAMVHYRRSISDIAWILNRPKEAYTQYVKTAGALHDLFIRPVKTKLSAPVRHLVIVPQGGLDQISFDALLTGPVDQGKNGGYKDLPYLFRQYTIQQAYSATAYCKLKGEASKNTAASCLAFAPGFAGKNTDSAPVMLSTLRDGQQALPGTQKEIDLIARHFEGKLYRGAQATEVNFKKEAGAYPIIHLATHGRADNEMPGRSHLLFTDQTADSTEDNTLYAYEIANLSLQADLVVLSGCETGYGSIARGEGIMSLGRSFIHAGSRSVLTSLWKVDDDASATLMSNFYAALADGQSKPEAINNARQAYLAQADNFKSHPFFWAAFTFTGDDRPLDVPADRTLLYALAIVSVIATLAAIAIRRARSASNSR